MLSFLKDRSDWYFIKGHGLIVPRSDSVCGQSRVTYDITSSNVLGRFNQRLSKVCHYYDLISTVTIHKHCTKSIFGGLSICLLTYLRNSLLSVHVSFHLLNVKHYRNMECAVYTLKNVLTFSWKWTKPRAIYGHLNLVISGKSSRGVMDKPLAL